jgi:predicted CXXCH cytochrome family protein
LSDPDVFSGDVDLDSESAPDGEEHDRRGRRWYGLLALVLLLLLLLCCATTTAQILVTRGPDQAQFISRNIGCLQCHTEKIPDFSKKTVHSPFMKRDCTVCHTPHGSQMEATVRSGASTRLTRFKTLVEWLPLKWWFDSWGAISGSSSSSQSSAGGTLVSKTTRGVTGSQSQLTMPEDELCWMCHGNLSGLRDDTYQHLPFKQGRCTECHDPHASDYSALLKQAPNKLCFTCHPIGKELNRMQAHPPAKQGWCTDCHNPHASNYRGILVARQRQLCFTCHPTVASLSGMAVQHQPFKNDNCTGCHEPHGSDSSPLLVKPQPELCYTCHPLVKNQFSQASHHPIGLNLTCASCHDPHAAQYPGLLVAQSREFCYQCHGDKRDHYEKSAHNVNDCTECHTPHGSAYKPLLVEKQPDLCLHCHPNVQGRNKHPFSSRYFDVHAARGLTCSSTCHNPHGSEYDSMMREYHPEQDGLCLQCHKTVGVYF